MFMSGQSEEQMMMMSSNVNIMQSAESSQFLVVTNDSITPIEKNQADFNKRSVLSPGRDSHLKSEDGFPETIIEEDDSPKKKKKKEVNKNKSNQFGSFLAVHNAQTTTPKNTTINNLLASSSKSEYKTRNNLTNSANPTKNSNQSGKPRTQNP